MCLMQPHVAPLNRRGYSPRPSLPLLTVNDASTAMANPPPWTPPNQHRRGRRLPIRVGVVDITSPVLTYL